MNIANQGFPATRADLNNALQALVSNSSGTSAPTTTFANQWWYDTTNNKLYIRNEANNAWIQVAVLDQTNNEWQITTGVIQAKDSDGLALNTDDGTTRLKINDSDGSVDIKSGGTEAAPSLFLEGDSNTGLFRPSADNIAVSTGGSERCRVNNSGHFLVGVDSTSGLISGSSNVGSYINQNGGIIAARSGDAVAHLNRLGSFGEIIELRKDGAIAGKIGSESGGLTIDGESGHTGFRFANDAIIPRDSGADTNGADDLGSINNSWRNIFLGGGAYIGGTTSANYLDYYEEDAWTVTVSDATSGGNTATGNFEGRYVRVGRLVHITCRLVNINITGMTSGNSFYVQGLPFAASMGSGGYATGPLMCDRISFNNYAIAQIQTGTSYIAFRDIDASASDTPIIVSDIVSNGGSDILLAMSYHTA